MLRQLVTELALGLRAHVLPYLGAHAARGHVHAGAGGDVTFEIDREAEGYVERFLAERAPQLAYYSEDRGLVQPATSQPPPYVLLIDPVDGTRPALAGFESSCVSVAAAPLDREEPTMVDVELGVVVEIKSGSLFVAERGRGLEIHQADGTQPQATLSPTDQLEKMFWTLGFRGRPALPLITVLEELIDASSVGGSVFDLGSASYDLTRLVTGQLDAYLDIGARIVEDVPALRARFEEVGGGAVLNNSPYDLAAAVLCATEAGAMVTDARGEPLDVRPLLGSGHDYQMSCVAAANERLHALILEVIENGFARLARGH